MREIIGLVIGLLGFVLVMVFILCEHQRRKREIRDIINRIRARGARTYTLEEK